MMLIMLVSISAIVLGNVVYFGIGARKSFNKRTKALIPSPHKELTSKAKISEPVRQLLKQYEKLSELLKSRRPYLSAVRKDVLSILVMISELLEKTEKKNMSQHYSMAIHYEAVLTKLISSLGDDYYISMKMNPSFWTDSDSKMKAVEDSVAKVRDELMMNIRRVNDDLELEHRVAIETLTKSEKFEGNLYNDIYKDEKD